jgi:predicted deacetylase
MKLVLDFDDFSPLKEDDCLDSIYWLIDKVPNIKLSFFTIPCHKGYFLENDPFWCQKVRELVLDKKIVLGVHGYRHDFCEFGNITKGDALFNLENAEYSFREANLHFVKCFKPPNWAINQNTYDVLYKLAYTHCYTHPDFRDLADFNKDRIKSIIYNWNLKDDYIDNGEELILGHGHASNYCGNYIYDVKERIVEFCQKYKPEFKFIHEI